MAYSVLRGYAKTVFVKVPDMLTKAFVPLLIATVLAAPALAAPPRGVEDDVRRQQVKGEILPFDVIAAKTTAQVGGTLIGSDYDAGSQVYRLRYMRGSEVFNVDVDARTGRRLPRGRF